METRDMNRLVSIAINGEKMLRLIVIALTLSLALAPSVHALTMAQGVKLGGFLDTASKELGQATTNLLGMTAGMQEPEYSFATRIYDNAASADQVSFTPLLTVVLIYTGMKDSRDQATVKKYIVILARAAVKASNRTIDNINRDVIALHSPAAIAEAQKIRDLVQKIRDEIQRTIPDS